MLGSDKIKYNFFLHLIDKIREHSKRKAVRRLIDIVKIMVAATLQNVNYIQYILHMEMLLEKLDAGLSCLSLTCMSKQTSILSLFLSLSPLRAHFTPYFHTQVLLHEFSLSRSLSLPLCHPLSPPTPHPL